MTDSRYCSGCLRDKENSCADSWCSDCSEVVCKTCAKVHMRFDPPHKVVPFHQVSDLSVSILNRSKNCEVHMNHKIVLFCTQHDEIICDLCHSESHTNCKSVISLERAAQGVKSGTALEDLQKRMMNLSEFLLSVIKKKDENSETLDKERVDILQKIFDIRQNINKHLDKIEHEMNESLEEKYATCKKNVTYERSCLERRHNDVKKWLKDIAVLRKGSSDVHFFQNIKILDAKTHKEERDLHKETAIFNLEFHLHEQIQELSEIFKSFGAILETTKAVKISVPQDKIQQSQVPKGKEMVKDDKQAIHSEGQIQRVFKRVFSFQTSVLGSNVKIDKGCFASNNILLLPAVNRPFLYVCNYDGSQVETVKLQHNPWSVAMMDKSQAIVTLKSAGFQTLDVSTRKLGHCIKLDGIDCGAVACFEDQIWIQTGNKNLLYIDVKGKILKKLTTMYDPWDIHFNRGGNLYYTEHGCSVIQHITTDGQERTLYSNPDLMVPFDVDDDGSLYVAVFISNAIHKISQDGQIDQVLLSEKDGIMRPYGLCYNDETNEILIFNKMGQSVEIYKRT